jgi:predicted transcriptional regulator
MKTIIEQLRSIRQKAGIKQATLGDKLGLPQSHISKIEQGATDPRLSTVSNMARVLDQQLMLVPRQQVLQVKALLEGEDQWQGRWQPDEDEENEL